MRAALRWAAILGGVGFACGFFGPIVLAPDANQGPLLGIFISGPGGAALGLLLGLAASLLPLSARAKTAVLAVAGVALAAATLYASLPPPEYRGKVVDAEVLGCAAPASALPAALADWDGRIARTTWSRPRPGWREEAERAAREDRGAILELRVLRETRVYENRRPWDKGTFRARPWTTAGDARRYYVPPGDASCAEGPKGGRALYFPTAANAGGWPSTALPDFLDLLVLGPVPDALRPVLAP